MAYHYSQELYRLKKYNLYNKLQKG
jgi:hypothetical protein